MPNNVQKCKTSLHNHCHDVTQDNAKWQTLTPEGPRRSLSPIDANSVKQND